MDERFQFPAEEQVNPQAERRSAGELDSASDVVFRSKPVVALVCPHAGYRSQLRRSLEVEGAKVSGEHDVYPGYAGISSLIDMACDAYLVEIDSDQDLALDLVENICARKPTATVMVYSALNDQERMVASMRAGAREFLSGSVAPAQLREALLRATARHAEQGVKKAVGKTIVFWSAKGGSGVSTLAANFAMALRSEAGEPVLLADLNPQFGSLSVLLGLTPRFTITDALKSAKRLDAEFLSTLVSEHKSGVSFIAAPDTFSAAPVIEARAVARLIDLTRNQYPWVVIDAGPSLGSGVEPVFQMADVIYLVTQLDIPSLHNTQRFLSHMLSAGDQRIEVIVNRYDSRKGVFDDEGVAKALGQAPKWKIPNDYTAAHRAANTGHPLILEKSPVAQALRALARSACGKASHPAKRKGSWGIFK
jgi:pilus assembly protein CpaE